MTTYVLYNKASKVIRRIDSAGSGADGPDRDPSVYSSDPAFVAAHAIWKVPLAFIAVLRPDILHAIGTNARVVIRRDTIVGIQVFDRTELEERAKGERAQVKGREMLQHHSRKKQIQQFLTDHPTLTDNARFQEQVVLEDTATIEANGEYERVLAGGAVPLAPILDARAGQEIKIDE